MRKSISRALLGALMGVLLFLVLSWIWYSVAANYDYDALAGTYVLRNHDRQVCTLYLHADGSFAEELSDSGNIRKSQGRWHRSGEAHVTFSPEFLRVPSEELNAAGQAHGEFDKTFGLFPKLVLAPLPGGPSFHRKLFG
jgi:hypothetical protein